MRPPVGRAGSLMPDRPRCEVQGPAYPDAAAGVAGAPDGASPWLGWELEPVPMLGQSLVDPEDDEPVEDEPVEEVPDEELDGELGVVWWRCSSSGSSNWSPRRPPKRLRRRGRW